MFQYAGVEIKIVLLSKFSRRQNHTEPNEEYKIEIELYYNI